MLPTVIWGEGKAGTASDGRMDSWSLFYTSTVGRMVFTCDNSCSLISGQQSCPDHSSLESGDQEQEGRGVAGRSQGRRWPDVPALSRPAQRWLAFLPRASGGRDRKPPPPGDRIQGRPGDGVDPPKVLQASHWGPTWNPPPKTAGIAAESATHARARCRPGPAPSAAPPRPVRLAPRLTPSDTGPRAIFPERPPLSSKTVESP